MGPMIAEGWYICRDTEDEKPPHRRRVERVYAKKLVLSTYPQHMHSALEAPLLFVQQLGGIFAIATAAALLRLREMLLTGGRALTSGPGSKEREPAQNVDRDERSVRLWGSAEGEE